MHFASLAFSIVIASQAAPGAESPHAKGEKNSIGMIMVLIPAGEFVMGQKFTEEEKEAGLKDFSGETFTHRVRISKPFYMGKHEVTVAEFKQFVKATGYQSDSGKPRAEEDDAKASSDDQPDRCGCAGPNLRGDSNAKQPVGPGSPEESGGERQRSSSGDRKNPTRKAASGEDIAAWPPACDWRDPGFPQTESHPVACINWHDAQAFCRWLSEKEGVVYRLPTEAEWEYACRAGTRTHYYNGNDPEKLPEIANVADESAMGKLKYYAPWRIPIKADDGYAFTAPVGRFRANSFGLHDMHGNVWEWCGDWFAADYYRKSPVEDPSGPKEGHARILRGGAFGSHSSVARSGHRYWLPPTERADSFGFRVVREAYTTSSKK